MISRNSYTTGQLEEVLTSLDNSLQVRHITVYDLEVCAPGDITADVLARTKAFGFDQIPVKDGSAIIGVLQRTSETEVAQVQVADAMERLQDNIIIESSTGILSYIYLAADQLYHLVIVGREIRGIVTPSDLLKLPVRIVLFTFLTHLEATMAAAIEACCPNDSWLDALTPQRRAKVEEEHVKGEKEDVYIGRLAYTQWGDKKTIIAKKLGKKYLGSVKQFKEDLETLGRLRDDVMHGNKYLDDAKFLSGSVHNASHWIKFLAAIIHTSLEAGEGRSEDQ